MELMMDEIIRLALKEDIGAGDITTLATVAEDAIACGELVTRQDGIACGLEVCARCFALLDPAVRFEALKRDGEPIFAGETIARVSGPARSILSAERTALNFLQRLCAVATKARQTRELVPAEVRVVDTRKTTPGLRALEKYAVRCGGCENHRFNRGGLRGGEKPGAFFADDRGGMRNARAGRRGFSCRGGYYHAR